MFLECSLSPPCLPGDGKAMSHVSPFDTVLSQVPQAEAPAMSEATSTRFTECLPAAWECQGTGSESVVPETGFDHIGGKRDRWQSFPSRGERD